jgi:hypothetical protein
MAFQRVHVATILHWVVVAARNAYSRLGVLPGFLPISLHDLLHAYGDGFRS